MVRRAELNPNKLDMFNTSSSLSDIQAIENMDIIKRICKASLTLQRLFYIIFIMNFSIYSVAPGIQINVHGLSLFLPPVH